VAQVKEHLPSKLKALNSNPSTTYSKKCDYKNIKLDKGPREIKTILKN
jgi:hypothetical protein